jgi:peroxiredoxin
MRSDDLYSVPPDLPIPEDDGACAHLLGAAVPDLPLAASDGSRVRLDRPGTRLAVVYAYPRTGLPHESSPPGWDEIPGARGCTPQSCAFRERHDELRALGASVYGLSTQSTAYQREMAARLGLPFLVLSDAELKLTAALGLPTFRYGDWTLLRRFTLVLSAGRIVHVIYPVFPPGSDALAAAAWLRERNR